MAVAAFVAALGLELEHPQLLAAHVRDDLGGDLHVFEAGLVEHGLLRAVHQRLQLNVRALGSGEALDEQPLAALDAVLLAAGLHDRVHVCVCLDSLGLSGPRRPACAGGAVGYSGLALALAAERRRPPLRPRRRGLDCRPSSAPSPCSSSPSVSAGAAGWSSGSESTDVGESLSPASRRASTSSLSTGARLRRERGSGASEASASSSAAFSPVGWRVKGGGVAAAGRRRLRPFERAPAEGRAGAAITSPFSSSSSAVAAVRPPRSMRTIRFSPTNGEAPAMEMM